MEEFLDDCLVGEGQMTDKQFKITFRYIRKVIDPSLMEGSCKTV
jgi:hypothetical protein